MTDATDRAGAIGPGVATGPRRLDAADPADLAGCLALSTTAGWNQTAADWSMMLDLGCAWGSDGPHPSGLVASTLALPFSAATGQPFAWISMVLVTPDWRGRGLATRLVAEALGWLRGQGLVAVLDATPAGFPVYRRLGFEPTWGFARHRRDAVDGGVSPTPPVSPKPPPPPSSAPSDGGSEVDGASEVDCGLTIRPLAATDWPAILALDRPAFGADRTSLLRVLAQRLPAVATVAERHGALVGYCLGRGGREASQIGPLFAPDPATARALLGPALAAIPGPVYLDLADRHDALLPWLQSLGFREQRPFTRMVLGASVAPGEPSALVLMGGPELG